MLRYVELQGELSKSDILCDHEESTNIDEEIVQCEYIICGKVAGIGLRLSDLQCDLKEECDKVQGELVEILRKENVRCDSEKMSEILQGE